MVDDPIFRAVIKHLRKGLESGEITLDARTALGELQAENDAIQSMTMNSFSSKTKICLPHISDFRQIFPEFSFSETKRPMARQWTVRRHGRGRIWSENIAVGPACMITGAGSRALTCYVRCSDEVLGVIDRWMAVPPQNGRIELLVEVVDRGNAFVSVSSIDMTLYLACIDANTIPMPRESEL